jgi:hypothetical protein
LVTPPHAAILFSEPIYGKRYKTEPTLDSITGYRKGRTMKFDCAKCSKTYNFNNEKLPDKAFSFTCTQCGTKNRVTREKIVFAKMGTLAHASQNNRRRQHKRSTDGKKGWSLAPKIRRIDLKPPVVKLVGLLARLSGRSERQWLFSLTKFATVFSIAALMLMIALGGFAYYHMSGHTAVTYAGLEHALYLKKDPTLSIQSAVPGIPLSDRVKKYLGGEHRESFVEWINGLEAHQKAEFIRNLDHIVAQAQKLEPEHVYDFITEYKTLKYRRSVQKPLAPLVIKAALIVALMAMISLLGLFCLILLQLSWQKAVFVAASTDSKTSQKGRRRLFRKPAHAKT